MNAGLAFVYPEICQICGESRATPPEGYVCGRCRAQVQFIEAPMCERCGRPFQGDLTQTFECAQCQESQLHFSFARSAAVARSTLLEAIHAYKYRAGLWLEPFLTQILISRALPQLANAGWDLIVPVPLHPTKQRERGFNQSAQLAKHLARELGLPFCDHVLRRIVPTQTQTRLTREERHRNMRNAFAGISGEQIQGRRVIIVDDVFTTGATTSACAGALIKAGAAEVCVWTLARGI